MKYLVRPRPLLGPCRCEACGEPLWWAKRKTRYLGNPAIRVGWREEDGVLHRCPNVASRRTAA